ncbi:helix-turn-helix domain-containing protein [Haloarchaeobius litoreus]|uniref:Helix-turn-helix domain-containing protein n=1 Tax=Haloarchaeobius litoreus TaxID=755306 RepID=A0ABD6DM96_9EURY|nr:helix-turn-helix domain-containing protein [Haloarchaeobius litoreus]
MQTRQGEFERIRTVLAEADTDEPMSAREIVRILEEHDLEIDSPHRVATVLGRHAERGDVEVIRSQPYRYRVQTSDASG